MSGNARFSASEIVVCSAGEAGFDHDGHRDGFLPRPGGGGGVVSGAGTAGGGGGGSGSGPAGVVFQTGVRSGDGIING